MSLVAFLIALVPTLNFALICILIYHHFKSHAAIAELKCRLDDRDCLRDTVHDSLVNGGMAEAGKEFVAKSARV